MLIDTTDPGSATPRTPHPKDPAMALGIYKRGQGYWTRLMSAIAYSTIVVMGGVWTWKQVAMVRIGDVQPVYIQAGAFTLVCAIFGWLVFYLVGRQRKVVDFMIATEGEMKKVNWSSRKEILGSTWVVIGLTLFIAVICFTFDLVFQYIFTFFQVLETKT
ncbi:MAG: preprotein translocase subunit SecE [Planctomycetota bacterium]